MRKTKLEILEAVHETAKGLHTAGAIDQVTMRQFDRPCLPTDPPLRPEQIRRTRKRRRLSKIARSRANPGVPVCYADSNACGRCGG